MKGLIAYYREPMQGVLVEINCFWQKQGNTSHCALETKQGIRKVTSEIQILIIIICLHDSLSKHKTNTTSLQDEVSLNSI